MLASEGFSPRIKPRGCDLAIGGVGVAVNRLLEIQFSFDSSAIPPSAGFFRIGRDEMSKSYHNHIHLATGLSQST